MDEHDWLVERFQADRARLRAVAYRILGSLSDADDAVQEAWLRLGRADTSGVENLGGWLTTVVARVCLNMLRSRQSRREDSLDARVPDPILSRENGVDPQDDAVLADSIGLALLVVLETLTPTERLAFVLHDMFAVPFDEIAPMLGRSPTAARQLASRARRRVRGAAPTPDPDVVRPALVNGAAGVVVTADGRLVSVMAFTVRGGKVVEIDTLSDPERLDTLDLAVIDD